MGPIAYVLGAFLFYVIRSGLQLNTIVLLNKTNLKYVSVGGVPKGFEHRLSKRFEVVERE